jgi:hypothetical protein
MENDFTIDEILAIDLKPKRKAEPIKKMKCPKYSGKKTLEQYIYFRAGKCFESNGKGFIYKVK